MLQQMMEQEKAERDLHFKQKYGEKEKGGFQRQSSKDDGGNRTLRPQPPGSPPS